MKLPRNAKIFRGQLEVAPFMGVFLLMLIFVMLQQNITFMPGIPVALPEAVNLAGVQGPAVTLVLDRQGQIYFDNQLLDPGRPGELRDVLARAVAAAGHPVTLIVQADRNVRLDAWTELNLVAREAGIRDVLLAVRPVATRP
jgi:biopolymer transport protein ExbD